MNDPIYSAASYLERVCTEIIHLSEEVSSAFAKDGFDISDHDHNLIANDQNSGLRYGFSYFLKRIYRRQRRDAQLVLQWDLWRPDGPSTWPHRNTALLLVAYDAVLQEGWDTDLLSIRNTGQLEDADVRAMIERRCNDRLLLCKRQGDDTEYARHAWLFGVPLGEIHDLADASRMVIDPVRALLRSPQDAATLLQTANAVAWPAPET